MSFDPLGESISRSALIRALDEKLLSVQGSTFRFPDQLNGFAERVREETRFVSLTFPEFTDHSADIHFPNLFNLTTKLLGETLLRDLYAEELFILAAGLYAHDWGMAVSAGERELILTGDSTLENHDPLWTLPDEQLRLQQFAQMNDVVLDEKGHARDLPDPYWREYVRITHADRSAIRAQRYFEIIDGGVAQAVAALCKGHWLDIEAIDSQREFPAELNVLNARINLRTLALFVRLIDRFDISEDRTPFAIWRFVGPRDPKSQREWKKHRALRPVHTEPYLTARCVVVDGTASDPDVYADLLDLRDCCERELRETCDLLARHRDERISFDLAPIIHWNVKPQGFEPVEIRFEFDRRRMFEILGGEIYQGDPCVFLRELLQNSIDAIATRCALQALNPREGVVSGLVEFHVQHQDDGSCRVECRDNGIGMDDYIVRRYLAVAGKSYYRSEDFARLGLAVDPISRFGIGILSCFMVSDTVEIITRRDPKASSNAKPLRLNIPSPERQWRVYRGATDSPVGTSVTVAVKGEKLFDDKGVKMLRLPVTDYIASIAGFVRFPIFIEERGISEQTPIRRAIVIHPETSRDATRVEFGDDVEIHQLRKEYPFDEAFITDDIEKARQLFVSHVVDIRKDLRILGCDGFVIRSRLADESLTTCPAHDEVADKRGVKVISPTGAESTIDDIVGINPEFRGYKQAETTVTRSAALAKNWSVYLDGILLAAMPPPKRWAHRANAPLPLPIVRVNFHGKDLVGAAVSRLTLERDKGPWEAPIWAALKADVQNSLQLAETEDSLSRNIKIANSAMSYGITPTEFANVTSAWQPFGGWLNPNGTPELEEISPRTISELSMIPDMFEYDAHWYVEQLIYGRPEVADWDTLWRGPRSLVARVSLSEPETSGYLLARSNVLKNILRTVRLQFLMPPRKNLPPIPQVILGYAEPVAIGLGQLLDIAVKSPMSLTSRDREAILLGGKYRDSSGFLGLPYMNIQGWTAFRALPFAKPFESSFAYGSSYWNARHPTTAAVVSAASLIIKALREDMNSEPLKKIRNLFNRAMRPLEHGGSTGNAKAFWDSFWEEFRAMKLCENARKPPFPRERDFVPKTWIIRGDYFQGFDWNDVQTAKKSVERPFGQIITEWPTSKSSEQESRRSGGSKEARRKGRGRGQP